MQELAQAEAAARAEVQARDEQLEDERERQAGLEARVKELVQAEEAARADVQARDEELKGAA